MNFPRIKLGLVATLLISSTSLVYGYGYYHNQLFLTVQKEGRPLFKAVELTIYKLNKERRHKIYTSQRHTAVLPLPPGEYEASVVFQNREVRQPFNLHTYEARYLTLNMD